MDKTVQPNIEDLSVCTSCGYLGESETTTKGSFLIEIVLWCFFIIPGLIYTIWRLTSKHSACPKCGNSTMIPADSPRGKELLKQYKNENKNIDQLSSDIQPRKKSPIKAFVVFILIPLGLIALLNLLSNIK